VAAEAAPAAAALPAAQPAAAPAGPGVPLSSPENRLELRAPAAYWEAQTGKEIAQKLQGGCGQQVPPDLVFVLQHRDAPAQVIITRSAKPFLMRNKDDLEAFEQGFMKAVKERVSGQVSDEESGYEERDGMVIHRYALTATPSAGGGGCAMAAQSAGPPQKLRFVFVDYFLRPQGEDAVFYRAGCRAFAETYEKMKPEFDSVLSSIHFTGKLADQFFDPAAPVDKVPTAKQAAKEFGGGGGSSSPITAMMLAGALVLAIWLIWRRRKQPQI
jgi:hypothetical protein